MGKTIKSKHELLLTGIVLQTQAGNSFQDTPLILQDVAF